METVVSTSYQRNRLTVSACPAHRGLNADDLVIEKPGDGLKAFVTLDYLFDRAYALTHATQ